MVTAEGTTQLYGVAASFPPPFLGWVSRRQPPGYLHLRLTDANNDHNIDDRPLYVCTPRDGHLVVRDLPSLMHVVGVLVRRLQGALYRQREDGVLALAGDR